MRKTHVHLRVMIELRERISRFDESLTFFNFFFFEKSKIFEF
jgi:hypothetical protein